VIRQSIVHWVLCWTTVCSGTSDC